MLALAVNSATAGTVIHVPDDQPTIQAGINAAVNGDAWVHVFTTFAVHSTLTYHTSNGRRNQGCMERRAVVYFTPVESMHFFAG
jgi:hypothetical protein